MVGAPNTEYIINTHAVAVSDQINSKYLTNEKFRDKFPYLNVSKSDEAVLECNNAGYISPRRLIQAQLKQAKNEGCHVINEIVNDVIRIEKDGEYCMRITTDTQKLIFARKVLLTTGAFTGFRNLLPSGLQLNTILHPLTVAKVEISEESFKKIRYKLYMVSGHVMFLL